MARITEEIAGDVIREATYQLVQDIGALIENILHKKVHLYLEGQSYGDPLLDYLEPPVFVAQEIEEKTAEYRTWFGVGRKKTRIVQTDGKIVFKLGYSHLDHIYTFEIFVPETLEPIKKSARVFAKKHRIRQGMKFLTQYST